MLRRSFSSSFMDTAEESSATIAIPARPAARKTIFWLRGSIWTGSSSMFQPRRMDCIAASAAPGWPLIRENAARSALRARISIATSRPTARPRKMPYQRFLKISQLTPMPTTIDPSIAAIISGAVALSISWVYLNTSIICLKRPGCLVPSAFFFPRFFSCAAGLVSLLRAMVGGVLSGSRASAAHGVLAGGDARGFLRGGLVLVEVAQVLGGLAAQLPHGLRPELPGTVGGADHGAGHGGQEAHLLGDPGQLEEFLGFHPAIDGVVQLRGPQVLGDGDDVAAGLTQPLEGADDLLGGLAHPQDQVRLGDHPGVRSEEH